MATNHVQRSRLVLAVLVVFVQMLAMTYGPGIVGLTRAAALEVDDSTAISKGASASHALVTLLCTFPDERYVAFEPAYMEALLAEDYPGLGDYWREVSYGHISLAGSRVAGWYTLPQPATEYGLSALSNEAINRLLAECVQQADADVWFPEFAGINIVLNHPMRGWGGERCLELDGQTKCYGISWLGTGLALWHGTVAHEIGHTLGLAHSFMIAGDPYSNPWDVMSTSAHSQYHSAFGPLGQHPIAYQKDRMGWIAAERKLVTQPGTSVTVEVERLAQPGETGYLLVEVPLGGAGGRYYTVEARRQVGYDSDMPEEGILIHEVDQAREMPARLVVHEAETVPQAGTWAPGMTYDDPAGGVRITVERATASGYVVTIQAGLRPADRW